MAVLQAYSAQPGLEGPAALSSRPAAGAGGKTRAAFRQRGPNSDLAFQMSADSRSELNFVMLIN